MVTAAEATSAIGDQPPVGVRVGAMHTMLLTKFAPILLIQCYFVFLRSRFDPFPGRVAFRIGHALHLLKARDCVADVSSIMDGFFTFLGESEVPLCDMVAASFSDLRPTPEKRKRMADLRAPS